MKIFILLLLVSCTHTYKVHKTSGIATSLVPYVENFKLNHPSGNIARENPFPVNFTRSTQSAGVCYLRKDIKDREVLINADTWEANPERRQYIVNYLLSACYGFNFNNAPLYEIHLTSI